LYWSQVSESSAFVPVLFLQFMVWAWGATALTVPTSVFQYFFNPYPPPHRSSPDEMVPAWTKNAPTVQYSPPPPAVQAAKTGVYL
jgi:hypothetical protein